MNVIQKSLYYSLATAIKLYQRMFLDLRVQGREFIPAGPKLYASNHITSTDPYWLMSVFTEPVHVIVGPGYKSRVSGWVLNSMQQINAMPEHRKTVVDQAVRYLEMGESIYAAPEGDIQEPYSLGTFYPGVAKIYQRIQIPIIPIALVAKPESMKAYPRLDIRVEDRVYRGLLVLRGSYYIRVGKPYSPECRHDISENENQQQIMDELKSRIHQLVQEVRADYQL